MLETKRLILRPFQKNDAYDVFEYLKEPAVNCFNGMRLNSLKQAKTKMKKHANETE